MAESMHAAVQEQEGIHQRSKNFDRRKANAVKEQKRSKGTLCMKEREYVVEKKECSKIKN